MAYVWDYFAIYPVESAVIITIVAILYIGWIKKFWYVYKPSVFATKKGKWRIRRYIGRIVEFETENGNQILTKGWKELELKEVHLRIYIRGQPIRKMVIKNEDIYDVIRTPKKLFKKEIIIDKMNLVWVWEKNQYEFVDDNTPIYIIKPDVLEKSMLEQIDNMDQKSTRGSKLSPPLIHSGYFDNHLPIPSNEYEEVDKDLQITPYVYLQTDRGSYGTYDDLMSIDEDEDDEIEDIDSEGEQ